MADNTNRREWESSPNQAALIAAASANVLSGGQLDPLANMPLGVVKDTTGTGSSYGTTTSTGSNVTKYTRSASDALIKDYLMQALGLTATSKVKAEFYKGLQAFLKANKTLTSTKTTTGKKTSKSSTSTTQGADADVFVKQFTAQVAGDILKANPNATLGGAAGAAITNLAKYSSDMGLFKSANELASTARDIISGKANEDDIKMRYNKDAQALYANFAPRLAQDASLTVRDLANPYIQMMADTFEGVSDNIKLTDDTIQKAINDSKGLINLGDFRTMLRKDKRFSVTTTAKREAAELGTAMIRSFGFGA